MKPQKIIRLLSRNRESFETLLGGIADDRFRWKADPDDWCLLELVCHLYDEEREDFRARVHHVLETPEQLMPPIDPANWVVEREYLRQDYHEKVEAFLHERDASVRWLQELENPKWDNSYTHPRFGPMTATLFLENWLAHDYLHIRQIIKIKYKHLESQSENSLLYAGNW